MTPPRIVFMGTAELACTSLAALADSSVGQVVAVVTQPDRPKGRDLKLQPSPVKLEALRRSLPVLQPERARNPEFAECLASLRPDLIVVAAYGQILPASLLALPRFGCINVHTSLLPKYRGAAPIQWAILEDEPETGVTIMKMDAGLDTGDILTQATTSIDPTDNAQTLHDRLAQMGAALLLETIPGYLAGNITPRPQPKEGMSYARKIAKGDGQLDWNQPARVLWNRVRAFTPWPGAFTYLPGEGNPRLLKVWTAEVEDAYSGPPGGILRIEKTGIVVGCGQQALRLLSVQREGGRRLTAQEFWAGQSLKEGEFFRSIPPQKTI
jgi:methionyl-tRNA formyltransferase